MSHATQSPEARRATDDGYVWLFSRQDMIDRGPIMDRMVEDIDFLLRTGGDEAVVTQQDLIRKGWTLAQFEDHGAIAFAYHRARHQPRKRRRTLGGRDSIRSMAVDLTALALFVAPVLFWAGRFAGAI
jgi:hypothetical protein